MALNINLINPQDRLNKLNLYRSLKQCHSYATHMFKEDLADALLFRVVIYESLDIVPQSAVYSIDVWNTIEDGLDFLLCQDGSTGLLCF